MADHDSLQRLAAVLVSELQSCARTVAAAESCSGGWIAKAITDISGSSAVFAYGVVSYSNGAKESLLGVHKKTLQDYGAVSEQVVTEMAKGVLRLSGADLSVAVSGVAGPGGGSKEKPVGTVWFAWAVCDGANVSVDCDCQSFAGDRDLVRELTVAHALRGVRERLASVKNEREAPL